MMTPSDLAKSESKKDWAKLLSDEKVLKEFRHLHWEGSFWEYLDIVKANPAVCRNAFQRMYDLIQSWGTETYVDYKKTVTHYKFFDDPIDSGRDAVFGLDVPLMKLVNFLKSAAMGYGTEKR
ncbi:MAG TPA: serine protein kinase, partial [Bdellovibrionota bacterium]|nr:serine protein kinase [Bdellovibrionota bacterium]